MSAHWEPTSVKKSVTTPWDHTHALAMMDLSLVLTEGHVKVGQLRHHANKHMTL